jgi:hypothetical protein
MGHRRPSLVISRSDGVREYAGGTQFGSASTPTTGCTTRKGDPMIPDDQSPEHDQARSDLGETRAHGDQTGSTHDQAGSDRDQDAADLDQAASDQD